MFSKTSGSMRLQSECLQDKVKLKLILLNVITFLVVGVVVVVVGVVVGVAVVVVWGVGRGKILQQSTAEPSISGRSKVSRELSGADGGMLEVVNVKHLTTEITTAGDI